MMFQRKLSLSLVLLVMVALGMAAAAVASSTVAAKRPLLIAHRGASGYAPEHTLAAYELALQQGADFIEQDLQVTKDGVLICVHDADLGRTTNVAEVFPGREKLHDAKETGTPERGWYAIDFTLAEIKRLDAGSWFNRANPFAARASFTGQRVPTLQEVIERIGNRAGLYIELKHFPFYKSRGFDMAEMLIKLLNANGFDRRGQRERVFIQAFHKETLLRLRELAPGYARVQLLPMEDKGREDSSVVTSRLASEIAAYARGVGPSKSMLASANDVATFQKAGLIVHPYTFRGSTSANARRPLEETQANGLSMREVVISDSSRYIGYGIDGGFTDYPALWNDAVKAAIGSKTHK